MDRSPHSQYNPANTSIRIIGNNLDLSTSNILNDSVYAHNSKTPTKKVNNNSMVLIDDTNHTPLATNSHNKSFQQSTTPTRTIMHEVYKNNKQFHATPTNILKTQISKGNAPMSNHKYTPNSNNMPSKIGSMNTSILSYYKTPYSPVKNRYIVEDPSINSTIKSENLRPSNNNTFVESSTRQNYPEPNFDYNPLLNSSSKKLRVNTLNQGQDTKRGSIDPTEPKIIVQKIKHNSSVMIESRDSHSILSNPKTYSKPTDMVAYDQRNHEYQESSFEQGAKVETILRLRIDKLDKNLEQCRTSEKHLGHQQEIWEKLDKKNSEAIKDINEKLWSVIKELDSTKAENLVLKDESRTLKNRNISLLNENSSMQNEINMLIKKINGIEDNSKSDREIHAYKSRISELSVQMEGYKKSIDNFEKKFIEINQSAKSKENQADQLIKDLTHENTSLKSDLEFFKTKMALIENLTIENANVKSELEYQKSKDNRNEDTKLAMDMIKANTKLMLDLQKSKESNKIKNEGKVQQEKIFELEGILQDKNANIGDLKIMEKKYSELQNQYETTLDHYKTVVDNLLN